MGWRRSAYGPAQGLPDTKIGTFPQSLYDEAKKDGWFVISMRDDWTRIFAFEQPNGSHPPLRTFKVTDDGMISERRVQTLRATRNQLGKLKRHLTELNCEPSCASPHPAEMDTVAAAIRRGPPRSGGGIVRPQLLNRGEDEGGCETKNDQAVDSLDRAQQLPAILQEDFGVTIARDGAERIQHCALHARQRANAEVEGGPNSRFETVQCGGAERRECQDRD